VPRQRNKRPKFTPEQARAAQKRATEVRKRNAEARKRQAARDAARAASATDALPPEQMKPDRVVDRARADALLGALGVVEPEGALRVLRLAPAWCRGWLEDADPASIVAAGGPYRYLGETWGGSRYRVDVVDSAGRETGTGRTFEVQGEPRSYGVPLEQPRALPAAAPVAYPPQPQPAAAPPVAEQLAQLAGAVARLADTQAALAYRVDRIVNPPPPAATVPPPAPPAASVPSRLRSAVAEVTETVNAVAEVNAALEQLRPPAPEAPAAPEAGGLSPFAKRTVERLIDKAVDAEIDAKHKGNGGAKPQADPLEPLEGVVEAEPCRS
jgi:hypothetical protein